MLVLSGPMMLPPLYCISILLGPRLEMVIEGVLLAGEAHGDDEDDGGGADDHAEHGEQEAGLAGAEAVDGERHDLAEHHGVCGRWPACVSKVPFSCAGLGTIEVAITLIRRLPVWQRFSDSC